MSRRAGVIRAGSGILVSALSFFFFFMGQIYRQTADMSVFHVQNNSSVYLHQLESFCT